MVSANVDIKAVEELVKNAIDSVTDFKRPMEKSLNLLRQEQRANFAQQGRLYGYWPKLAASTKKDRERKGFSPNRPILERTGKLKNGFKVSKFTKDEGEIVNTVKYAKYHQGGTSKMPKRKIIGSTDKSRKAIGVIFTNHIVGAIKGKLSRSGYSG